MTTSFMVTDEQASEVEILTGGTMTVSQFARIAFQERINRMQKRDDRARRENLIRDVEAMRPILEEILRNMGVIE